MAALSSISSVDLAAKGGMVNQFSSADLGIDAVDLASLRVLDRPDFGHVSLSEDNGINLVLSGDNTRSGALDFALEITRADGSISVVNANVEVVASVQGAGWALGQHYMLETGDSGRLVIEEGNEHRKVFVSASQNALSAADIAAREGLDASQITTGWLRDHPEYGGCAELALDSATGMKLWYDLNQSGDRVASHHLLFERGHEYSDVGRLLPRGASGESELAPIYIGAYGDGPDPVLNTQVNMYQDPSSHVVIEGLDIVDGVQSLGGSNFLVDDVSSTGMWNIQNVDGFTMREVEILDTHRADPHAGADYWHPSLNRTQGIFVSNSQDVLIEGTLFDHNGWEEGYNWDLTGDYQPPSYYSHNVYSAHTNTGVTFRDNIAMRGASFGAQIRSGGYLEDNLFLDNNFGFGVANGDSGGSGPIGNFSLLNGNVVTSGAHKRVMEKEGALTVGMGVADNSTLIDNIIAFAEDPNNPAEMATKTVSHAAYYDGAKDYFFDDTIVYGWDVKTPADTARSNENVEGLDPALLNQATIQNFTAQLLGQETATIADLATYLRAQAEGRLDGHVDADIINGFFHAAFGIGTTLRTAHTMLTFAPDPRGDGVRWDNRLNWSTGDLPGTQEGDSVDLAGNLVFYGTATQVIRGLSLGDGADFRLNAGKLTIAGELTTDRDASRIAIDEAGQLFFGGYGDSEAIVIGVAGGRLVNTGQVFGGVDLTVSDNGQAILAKDGGRFVVGAGDVVSVTGANSLVGFDDNDGDLAVFRMEDGAELHLESDASGMGRVGEFRSGAFSSSGNEAEVMSGIVLNGTLSLDLRRLHDTPTTLVLLEADELIGGFDDIRVTGMSKTRDATIRIDYDTDRVTLMFGAEGAGTGRISTEIVGMEDFRVAEGSAGDALWDALTAPLETDGLEAPIPPAPLRPVDLRFGALDLTDAGGRVEVLPGGDGARLKAGATHADYTVTHDDGQIGYFVNVGKIIGSAHADLLVTGDDPATPITAIEGGDGDDTILGSGRNDVLKGGRGNDIIEGGAGQDILRGGAGHDTLIGGEGDDRLGGKEGHDYLVSGAGNDSLWGDGGDDVLEGGDGDDRLDGGAGRDVLRGGAGQDTLSGGSGDDRMGGKEGHDQIIGGSGNDSLWGDAGDDALSAGTGHDAVYGGLGHDRLLGDAGNDTLKGERGDDHLYGGGGDDRLDGGFGDDVLDGGAGDDLLIGGSGADCFRLIAADAGRDVIADYRAAEGDVIALAHGATVSWSASAAGLVASVGETSFVMTDVERMEDVTFAWI